MSYRLGLTSAVFLVIANTVGVGVFTTSGFALADLHSPALVLLAWLVGGIVALCGALSYGALARQIPESGGEYIFLARTVHPLAGFVAGWISLLAGFTAPIAVAALTLQAYLGDAIGEKFDPRWLGTGAIVLAAVLHGIRLRAAVAVQNLAVALKLAAIAGLVAVGCYALDWRGPGAAAAVESIDPGAFAVTLVWISFSYSGWNAAVYVASEVRKPSRNVNRAMLLGTIVVIGIYVALNAVFVYAAPADVLAGRPDIGAVAAEALGGPWLRRAVTAIIALALMTSISAMVMAGSRVYARMADDGFMPRALAPAGALPSATVALQAALAISVVWVSGLAQVLGYVGFTLGLCAAGTVAGLLARRGSKGPSAVPIPGYPLVPWAFIVMTVGAAAFMVFRAPYEAFLGFLTASLGVPVYFAARRSSARPMSIPSAGNKPGAQMTM
ncbi:MAG: APC family permease [Candidatus Binataceae bacterium]